MVKFSWFKDEYPTGLDIRQVYGIVFSNDGNILLRIDDDQYKLTGGKPEKYEYRFEETLKREYLEELNVEIENIYYLGYLLVEENNQKYAQVRMIAKMKSFGKLRPDQDNGKLYKRYMSNIKNVKKYLNYPDEAGNKMIDDAIYMANEKYNISFHEKEYFI